MIECIALTVEDARRIELAGGDRIELVSALTEGGLTPSYALIEAVTNAVKIPVNVMIRPHSKSFLYTDEEIVLMKKDIQIAKQLNVNGVVFGVLNEVNRIHVSHLESLLSVCTGLDVTFHRAIDEIDVVEGIQLLRQYPAITNVLTSGGQGRITNHLKVIEEAVASSGHVQILIGGGLNFDNIERIHTATSVTDFHFGTAVRAEQSLSGEIEPIQLQRLKKLLSKPKRLKLEM